MCKSRRRSSGDSLKHRRPARDVLCYWRHGEEVYLKRYNRSDPVADKRSLSDNLFSGRSGIRCLGLGRATDALLSQTNPRYLDVLLLLFHGRSSARWYRNVFMYDEPLATLFFPHYCPAEIALTFGSVCFYVCFVDRRRAPNEVAVWMKLGIVIDCTFQGGEARQHLLHSGLVLVQLPYFNGAMSKNTCGPLA